MQKMREYRGFFSVRLLSVLRGHSFFFIHATTANDLQLRRISIPDFYPLHFVTILFHEKEPVFSILNVQCQTGELLVPFLWRLWYDAVLDWGLNPGPPAFEASILPVGYQWGGNRDSKRGHFKKENYIISKKVMLTKLSTYRKCSACINWRRH